MSHVPAEITDEDLDELLEKIKEKGQLLKEQRVWIVSMFLTMLSVLIAAYFQNLPILLLSASIYSISMGVWVHYVMAIRKLDKEFKQIWTK